MGSFTIEEILLGSIREKLLEQLSKKKEKVVENKK
jgi:hypothetical protein